MAAGQVCWVVDRAKAETDSEFSTACQSTQAPIGTAGGCWHRVWGERTAFRDRYEEINEIQKSLENSQPEKYKETGDGEGEF